MIERVAATENGTMKRAWQNRCHEIQVPVTKKSCFAAAFA